MNNRMFALLIGALFILIPHSVFAGVEVPCNTVTDCEALVPDGCFASYQCNAANQCVPTSRKPNGTPCVDDTGCAGECASGTCELVDPFCIGPVEDMCTVPCENIDDCVDALGGPNYFCQDGDKWENFLECVDGQCVPDSLLFDSCEFGCQFGECMPDPETPIVDPLACTYDMQCFGGDMICDSGVCVQHPLSPWFYPGKPCTFNSECFPLNVQTYTCGGSPLNSEFSLVRDWHCDEVLGTCVEDVDEEPCELGCMANGQCREFEGQCAAHSECDDGLICTNDECPPWGSCWHELNDACDDGDPCTEDECSWQGCEWFTVDTPECASLTPDSCVSSNDCEANDDTGEAACLNNQCVWQSMGCPPEFAGTDLGELCLP